MSAELVKLVQDMLKEETWTRATISNYSKEKLIELASIVERARNENCTDEILQICNEQLSHSRDSIIALYFSGMISLQKNTLDNTTLQTLVDIFKKNHKEIVVEYLCNSIIDDDPNNIFALRTLAEFYKVENDNRMWNLYAQIIKLDFEEAELAKLIGEHEELEGHLDAAIEYYKKAILRYINAGNINATKELWSKLVLLIPQEIDFFRLVKRKISKKFGDDKTAILLQELYGWYKDNKKWDIALSILKEILAVDQKDSWTRKEIIDCYKGKYEGHSHLDEYIKDSNLDKTFRNTFEAISDFEKHIAFDVHNYVFHRTWGVGIVRKFENENLVINFGKKTGIHSMSLKMAVNSLVPLSKDHIWVLKATKKQDELKKMVKDDKAWALKTIIKSFDNNCDFKKIKAELVPSVLSPGEWTSWNTAAKKILESDATFGVNPSDINMYTVRENEISKEEKLANEFKAQKQFFARIDIIMKYMDSDETDKTSEMFAEMFNYFTSYVKTLDIEDQISKINEQLVASYLVVQRITAMNKQLIFPTKCTFQQIYEKIAKPREMYELLKDTKNTSLRADFLHNIRMLPNWADEYIRLFPTVLNGQMLHILIEAGYTDKVQKLVVESFENYKDYRNAAIYFFKECQNEDWFKNAGISYEKQLITLIQLIELTFREISNHLNTTENKKINKAATTLLFKDDALLNYMFQNDENTVKKMYTLVDDLADLDQSCKAIMRNRIREKYPNFKFHVSEEKTSAPRGMLVTAKKLEEKKALLERMQDVDIPANAKEIEEAREKGDLKENAEYKAAKEHQHKLNNDIAKLQTELNRAIVFDPTTVTTAIISFATEVTLHNNKTNEDERYTILGPWESDPDNGVISYMAPFGNALMDYKIGENIQFSINEFNYDYTVKEINVAKI
ncbi:MAG: transcription elongation factor GreA [Treponema sp.]|nr:transcription elongation factor GreA [Treponema sp.]